jgi:hypothetical protein
MDVLAGIAASARPESDRADDERSHATILLGLIEEAGGEPFHTPAQEPFITILRSGHREHLSLRQSAFRAWAAQLFYAASGDAIGSGALHDTIGTLGGKALYDGPEHHVATRVGEYEGHLYLDLANSEWQAVRITAAGWEIIDDPPIRFRRPASMKALPRPVVGGDLAALDQFINIGSEADRILLISFLINAAFPTGPYPLIVFQAGQGDGKSTTSRVLRNTLDPHQAGMQTLPHNERDLMIAAMNSHILAFDNISTISVWLHDAFCRLSTGGGLVTRALYTDSDLVAFDAQRPVILNGIELALVRGDALDRALIIELPKIEEDRRREESVFWGSFSDEHPAILGAVLDRVVASLRYQSEVRAIPLRLPRMADFAVRVMAAEIGAPWPPGAFLDAYRGNRETAGAHAIDASVIGNDIAQLAETGFYGTAKVLLDRLEKSVNRDVQSYAARTKPLGLANELRRLAPSLARLGIEVVTGKRMGKRGDRTIIIKHCAEAIVSTVSSVSEAVAPCAPADAPADAGAVGPSAEDQPPDRGADASDDADAPGDRTKDGE